MPFSIRWTDRARLNLIDVGDFIAVRSPSSAFSFTTELVRRTEVLRDNPRIGRGVPDIRREDIRELLHGKYRIVYRVMEAEIHVLTVFEGRKLPNVDIE